jgi:Protein of unknown function (DUF2452)
MEGQVKKNPNPQGKGLVPVLEDLHALSVQVQQHRTPLDFFRDYCLSSLVLAADFRFKPVPDKAYYLYSTSRNWNLSLVGPGEWHREMPGVYVAHCLLRRDMTWHVEFTQMDTKSEESQKLENFVSGFVESLCGNKNLDESLPFYSAELPYYHRVLATGLAASLKHTMPRQETLTRLLQSSTGVHGLMGSTEQERGD